MDFIPQEREENSGIVQLLRLVMYVMGSLLLVSIIAALIVVGIYGLEALMDSDNSNYIGSMRIMLIATSIGIFMIPALFLAYTEKGSIKKFYGFDTPKVSWLAMVLLIIIVSMPFLEWTVAINQKMTFPGYLKWLGDWMRHKEDETAAITLLLLDMKGIMDLVINIVMIAIVPAVAEELMFRGAIQRSFTKIFNNPHVAIWCSAFIFSAIHIQFFGFLPRFLMGAAFGYIYFWSGSLWYAIFGHFLNNAYAVCVAWYMKKNNLPLSDAEGMHFAWYGYLISFALSILAFQYFKKQTTK
ncbi:CPBP family intramembrane glutamic endopeptidase [Pedobacter frigoris]|uniref:CPBP family intramembrane metalloprotease n=1 Tax=Pedobacter frigoris TaxID=2571272 RepID=A0A4U1CEJ6_9SPHI|nr:CPBP family intramembrane glutamic endopeptidase [Pedobacter frigoris]TKC04930.1 CPBP family intramembrane metalloprotease [Pedobacter frigoris]